MPQQNMYHSPATSPRVAEYYEFMTMAKSRGSQQIQGAYFVTYIILHLGISFATFTLIFVMDLSLESVSLLRFFSSFLMAYRKSLTSSSLHQLFDFCSPPLHYSDQSYSSTMHTATLLLLLSLRCLVFHTPHSTKACAPCLTAMNQSHCHTVALFSYTPMRVLQTTKAISTSSSIMW